MALQNQSVQAATLDISLGNTNLASVDEDSLKCPSLTFVLFLLQVHKLHIYYISV